MGTSCNKAREVSTVMPECGCTAKVCITTSIFISSSLTAFAFPCLIQYSRRVQRLSQIRNAGLECIYIPFCDITSLTFLLILKQSVGRTITPYCTVFTTNFGCKKVISINCINSRSCARWWLEKYQVCACGNAYIFLLFLFLDLLSTSSSLSVSLSLCLFSLCVSLCLFLHLSYASYDSFFF